MKKILIALMMLMGMTSVQAKTALVVISHGSPMPAWRKPVLDMEPILQQRQKTGQLKGIDYVRVAMMEFTEPTIATVISDCEKQGVDTIFAIPLFIAPSSHSDQDIPTIIGHKFDARTVADLREEGTKLVSTRMPIILGPTLSYDDVLEQIMTDNVKAMSENPPDEALLLIAHGDKQWTSFWQQKMQSICDSCKKSTGITLADYKFVAMGYKMIQEMTPAVKEYAKSRKRILVQGVYLTSTAREIAEMGISDALKESVADSNVEIVYSDQGILPAHSDTVADWIVKRTGEWLEAR